MAACKNTCCGHKAAGDSFETTTAPVESLLDFKEIVGLLRTMASTGIKNFVFKDANLDNLAELVATLAAENNYLKKLAALLSPVSTDKTDKDIVVSFGPAGVYTLSVPIVTDEQRRSVAAQFLKIAHELNPEMTPPDSDQLRLF